MSCSRPGINCPFRMRSLPLSARSVRIYSLPSRSSRRPSINAVGFLSCVDEVFRQSDIHIFPSECEGSPKSVYEACAAGLPQITTFESGDVVLNEVNGLIVPRNDVAALANAIGRLYKTPRRILQYGRAARQRAEAEFTWDHFRERLARAYDFVLRRRSTL